MAWVDVGVNLKHKAREFGLGGLNLTGLCFTRLGGGGDLDEFVEHLLHTKVVHRRSKEHRSEFARAVGLHIKVVVYAVYELGFFAQFFGEVFAHELLQAFVGQVVDFYDVLRNLGLGGVKQVELLLVQLVHALEGVTNADGPRKRAHADVELFFQLIQQVKGIAAFEVHFVDEDDHRGVTHAADFHQALGLGLHTFHAVDHQNDAVHRSQGAVGIFSKVLVTGGVEQVHQHVLVVEGHHRGGHRNPTLLLDLHEIRSSGFGDFVALDGTRSLDGTSKQEELLGQGGLTRIRVGNDGEGFALRDFGVQTHGLSGWDGKGSKSFAWCPSAIRTFQVPNELP